MTIEKRLANLENLVNALSKKIDRNAYYTDADMNGNRQSISNTQQDVKAITPYTATKSAYIDDTSVSFENVPRGNMSVYVGGVNHSLFERDGDRVTVKFEPLEEVTEVTISIV